MKRLLIATLIAAALLPATIEAKKKSDSKDNPVVATVNGKDIRLSEFEYLYNKNRSQQINPQTLDEYADMFVVYKLKVADAEAAGLDTTASFHKEYDQYVNDLAAPYLMDETYADSLRAELYGHMKTERKIAHIQLSGTPKNRALMDSIRQAVENGADFGEMAVKYSMDRNARNNQGVLGWVAAGTIPYEIEKPTYETPVGELTPVFETRFGVHLFKILEERPAKGEVLARHILKQTKDKSPMEKAHIRFQMDSILTLLNEGADFTKMAIKESQDPGTANKGGLLPWFGSGKMVPQFEEAAFALSKGQISEVIESPFGYHIIKVEDTRSLGPIDQEKGKMNEIMARDGRAQLPVKRKLDSLRPKYGVTVDQKTRDMVKDIFTRQGRNDSTAMAQLGASTGVGARVGDREITVGKVMESFPPRPLRDAETAMKAYDEILDHDIDEVVRELAIASLPEENPDFANLINEYRDGILLYEISNRKVWGRSTSDEKGLEEFFQAHKSEFSDWTEPRYKGFVAMAINDSVASKLKDYLNGPGASLDGPELSREVRKKFSSNARIERVLAKKGDNAIVDYVAFEGPKPEGKSKWQSFFSFRGKMIDQPEEAKDVKGAASTAWQKELEEEWVKSLRGEYPVTLNKKALKKVK